LKGRFKRVIGVNLGRNIFEPHKGFAQQEFSREGFSREKGCGFKRGWPKKFEGPNIILPQRRETITRSILGGVQPPIGGGEFFAHWRIGVFDGQDL